MQNQGAPNAVPEEGTLPGLQMAVFSHDKIISLMSLLIRTPIPFMRAPCNE